MELPGLADTLAAIGAEGSAVLYTGGLAERLVDDMAARGGLVTAADLASYGAVVRPALPTAAADWVLATNPPPAIGGAVLVAMLAALGPRPRDGAWTADDVAALVRAQHQVLDVRRESLDVAADRTSAAYDLLESVGWSPARSPSTAHVSVVDDEGTACAITASYGYGSGVTVPGTGLWLNNCLGELELNRGAPLSAGERLRSNMAPSVGRRSDGAVLAIGTPGADRITTALLQVVAAVAHGGMALQAAVDLPRLHVHHLEGDDEHEVRVEAEEDLPLPAIDLPVRRHRPHSMYFGGVGAALRHADGRLEAAGDPRRAGAVAVGP
jgi:gamma-glutamyltranspeptidase/glutathione hydrolase